MYSYQSQRRKLICKPYPISISYPTILCCKPIGKLSPYLWLSFFPGNPGSSLVFHEPYTSQGYTCVFCRMSLQLNLPVSLRFEIWAVRPWGYYSIPCWGQEQWRRDGSCCQCPKWSILWRDTLSYFHSCLHIYRECLNSGLWCHLYFYSDYRTLLVGGSIFSPHFIDFYHLQTEYLLYSLNISFRILSWPY